MKEEKCVLVINKPYSCIHCVCRGGGHCFAIEDNEVQDRFYEWFRHIFRLSAPGTLTWENCPLRPLPQKNKYDVEKYATIDYENAVTLGHYLNIGRNECIDEITGDYITQEEADLLVDKESKPYNEWILVSEKLPEEGQRVLCTHLGGLLPERKVVEHYFQEGEFVFNWDFDTDRDSPTRGQNYWGSVIAWMPFPEPYQGETE